MLIVLDGMRLISTANTREHWATKHRRESGQIFELNAEHGGALRAVRLPATVTFTRVAPKQLDGDNLRYAFKHLRDYIATQILPEPTQGNQHGRRGDDSDERITWQYGQRRGPYAVEVFIEC